MISVEEACQIIQSQVVDFGTIEIAFDNSAGCILREDIIADRDFPPFDRVAMDGIAIRCEDFNNGTSTFAMKGMVAAGDAQSELLNGEYCLEIMTGAILPLNADTVIPYEWLRIENDIATLNPGKSVVRGQNVHLKGRDKQAGELLISSGKVIGSSDIGVIASVGKTVVGISRVPKILVVSTGNELIPIDGTPLPHQIRRSNVHQLSASLKKLNIHTDILHLDDDKNMIADKLRVVLPLYDVLILCGGISAGKFDLIPSTLEELGVEKLFYKVKQKPGKPFWFGKHAGGCTVFGIPGNPVSSFLCLIRYIIPWIKQCLQKEIQQVRVARLSEDLVFKSELTQFIPVRIVQNENAELIAIPVQHQGSGDLASLVGADAFAEMPKGRLEVAKGEVVAVYGFE